MGKLVFEMVYMILYVGGKFGGGGYKVFGGFYGVGVFVVNVLLLILDVKVIWNGYVYYMDFECGKVKILMKIIGDVFDDVYGMVVYFVLDFDIFWEMIIYDINILMIWICEFVFLNKGLWIMIWDNCFDEFIEDDFFYEGGICYYVEYLDKNKIVLFLELIYVEGE